MAANKEVDDLNAKMAKYVKQELYDDTKAGDEEISTWPVETYNYVGECFYDDIDKDKYETEDVEAFYMDNELDNYPMERSGAQRTIQIPDQVALLLQFCALAVYGVCLSMSPTVVAVVSVIAGIFMVIYTMQHKQSDDEDVGVVPMEVDSASSDSLFGPVEPSKSAKTTKATVRRSGHVDPDEVGPYKQKWIDHNKQKEIDLPSGQQGEGHLQ